MAFVPPTELKLFARYGKQSRDEGRGDRTFITGLEKENESAAVKGAKIALEQRLRMEVMHRPYDACKRAKRTKTAAEALKYMLVLDYTATYTSGSENKSAQQLAKGEQARERGESF